jgi:hypothetical protein
MTYKTQIINLRFNIFLTLRKPSVLKKWKSLESLLLRETETFAELEDQMERIKGTIMEIRCFYRDRGNTEGNAAFSS